jgi:4-hydroxy-tetrahydrodipicolinate synthase
MAETGLGSEMVRAPRLPIEGSEREEILGVIRRAIAARPVLAAQ